MSELVTVLRIVASVLTAVGFLGTAAFVWVVSFGDTDGGANIGLGIVTGLCLVAGVFGIVVWAITLVLMAARRIRSRRRPHAAS